jgi:hypothetical protein
MSASATCSPSFDAAEDTQCIVEKYKDAIKRIGMNDAAFAQAYSTAIRVMPTGIRGH